MKWIQDILTSAPMQNRYIAAFFSSFFGRLANWRMPTFMLSWLLNTYVESFHIDMDDYVQPLHSHRSFQSFFTRELKPGARRFKGDICSPAEGFISTFGTFTEGQLLQVKGSVYQLRDLLLEDPFRTGSQITIYLGLGNYHRVHLPFDAEITGFRHIPGFAFSTNTEALTRHPGTYCKNERVVFKGEGQFGCFYLVMVGATCVSNIQWIDGLNNSLPVSLKQGDHIGTFNMGSTVVLILEDQIEFNNTLNEEGPVTLGQNIIK